MSDTKTDIYSEQLVKHVASSYVPKVEGFKVDPDKDAQLHVESREPKLVFVKWPWKVFATK